MQSFKLKFLGVTILQGVKFPIFLLIFEWALFHQNFHLLKQILSINLNSEVDFRLYGRHVKKSICGNNSAADRPISTKFGKQMQNDMPMTIHRSKSKPEIEFQYGGHPYSTTGSRFIWALDWANGRISKTRRRRLVLCGQKVVVLRTTFIRWNKYWQCSLCCSISVQKLYTHKRLAEGLT